MSLEPPPEPRSVCILRLSALGDVCHTLPVVRTLQARWPQARFSWILGATEARLVGDIPGIEFLVLDKARGLAGYRELLHRLAIRRFDLLLHMQNSWRGNVACAMVRAPLKVGFDRRQTKDLQWLFTNRQAPFKPRGHVMDVLFAFAEWCGAEERVLRWDIPVPAEARAAVERVLPAADPRPLLVISPCASARRRNWRNWTPEGYAAVADYAAEKHDMRVVLTGGRSAEERRYGDRITALARCEIVDLIGRSGLKELLAVLERAAALVCPDSGPAHMATAVGTPVIGLYATTNPDRAAPYRSRQWVVNKYPEASRAEWGLPVEAIPFGRRVRRRDAMARIDPGEVQWALERLMAARRAETAEGDA